MILAKTTVIGASIMCFRIEMQRHLRCFIIITYVLIILNISSDQYFLKTMIRTILSHVYIVVFKHDLGINSSKTFRTKAECKIIICIRTFRHKKNELVFVVEKYKVNNRSNLP